VEEVLQRIASSIYLGLVAGSGSGCSICRVGR
jgi:hypothetical protein